MKTQTEIETKLQDLEALILNLRETINSWPDNLDGIRQATRELPILEHQAKCLRWVLE